MEDYFAAMESYPPSAIEGYGYYTPDQAAALQQQVYTLNCQTGFYVLGLQEGEAVCTPIRVICTLITVSVGSAWVSRRKSIEKLLLFFSHYVAGLLHQLVFVVESSMISVCWAGENLDDLVKSLKFLQQASSNMYAVTNLAICVNLALIITSHRTLSRVKSVSSPGLIFLFLTVSIGAAAASVPSWDFFVLSGTGFWPASESESNNDWLTISIFYIEFFVGACMFVIISWLVACRMKEIKECWNIHARIRYYFVLTLTGTAVNLAIGICGTINVATNHKWELLVVVTWALRYIHIALDTFVLYGVLGARNMDERASSTACAVGGTGDGGYRGPSTLCRLNKPRSGIRVRPAGERVSYSTPGVRDNSEDERACRGSFKANS